MKRPKFSAKVVYKPTYEDVVDSDKVHKVVDMFELHITVNGWNTNVLGPFYAEELEELKKVIEES